MIITSKTPHLDLHGEIESMVEVLVNDFINENILLHNDVVVIIHGKSTNILTKEVHKVLKCYYFDKDLEEYLKLKEEYNARMKEEI